MNIYLVSQSKVSGYDTYDSFVVVASSEESARRIHPASVCGEIQFVGEENDYGAWVGVGDLDNVKVFFLGTAREGFKEEVVCASFNAG